MIPIFSGDTWWEAVVGAPVLNATWICLFTFVLYLWMRRHESARRLQSGIAALIVFGVVVNLAQASVLLAATRGALPDVPAPVTNIPSING